MAVFKIQPEQVGAAFTNADEELRERVTRGLQLGALRAIPLVVKATPADRGQARAAWDVLLLPNGANLFNDAPYAGILEAGSRPHRPPLIPILRWVVRKFGLNLEALGETRSSAKTRRSRKSFQDLSEVPWRTYRFALAVVETIERRGTKPHWMIRRNLKRMTAIARTETLKQLHKPLKGPT